MKILVIEDEPDMREVIIDSLEKEKFLVESAAGYHAAMDKVAAYDYDCILLDIMLPDGSGLSLLEEFKKLKKRDSVIIISAKNAVDDKVKGLNLGADDYLAKPFHLAELTARVKSVIRRKTAEGQMMLELNNITVDTGNRVVYVAGQELALNRKEFDILAYFMANKNRLINKTALAEHIWGDGTDQADDFEFIYSQIKNLRKKLKDADAAVEIQAVYGIGYKLAGR
ncbi:response regulator transcription factor [Fulvivirgaceae bacterium PWU4]|uniref:Response regulator transcription factor n=1 Tax=Chryseosolibacter histidini TaxID=2782349 RepID=A0AAP2DII5_9BACT|nr:response regulator transcription factor [Chryseosolibacter histidini]MBT1696950.1 response regulator transcription factor [Chryseosolibacter histidini]